MKKLILIYILFLTSLNATTLGHEKSDVVGKYCDGNYVSVDCPSNKVYLYGDSRVQKRFQVSSGVLKAPRSNPATYTNVGLDGSYKFANSLQENITCAIAIPDGIDISTT